MKKILVVLALLASTSVSANMINDYNKYESEGIVDSVLAKEYYDTRSDRKNTRKVIRADRKITRTVVKWGDAKPKKIRRSERKIARTINKMDLVTLNAAAIPSSIEEDIPEPSPLLLLGAGLVGLGVSRKFLVK